MKHALLTILFGVLLSGCAYQDEEADLIIHNARIYTCNEAFSVEEAMAIKDGKILEVGAERQIMNKYVADETIDYRLKPIYPVFVGVNLTTGSIKTYREMMIDEFIREVLNLQLQEGNRKDALMAVTLWRARQELSDEDQGSLEAGKRADFFSTSLDLMTAPFSDLYGVHITDEYREGELRDKSYYDLQATDSAALE